MYFKINKINLCNPLKRVIENSGLKEHFPQSHQVVYKFYVGRQAMFDNDYETAAAYFQYAFEHCPARYKKNKKIKKIEGHISGFEKLVEALNWCFTVNIREVSVYAFSIENFKRSPDEVNALFDLAREKFQHLLNEK